MFSFKRMMTEHNYFYIDYFKESNIASSRFLCKTYVVSKSFSVDAILVYVFKKHYETSLHDVPGYK